MALSNTRFGGEEIARLLAGAQRLWFIGIGGVHMCALALLARRRGFAVAGSDRAEGAGVARLRAEGVQVFIGHDGTRVGGADAVIYTLAVDGENPEYRAAEALRLPLFSRADFLDFLLLPYPVRVGVAGSHGKSTVTAMTGELLTGAGLSPTVVCGAAMRRFGTSYLWGQGDVCVFEACEYQDSFLSLSPTLAVLLNAGFDHADYFRNAEDAACSFGRFAALAGKEGRVLVNADDAAAMAATAPLSAQRITFGFSAAADFCAEKWKICGGTGRLLLRTPYGVSDEVQIPLPGRHNLQNALAAAGAASLCGVSDAAILQGLSSLRGVARRMEYKGMLCGARVLDDYAHHPDEIKATLAAAREMMMGGRLFVLFESHTYTRTAAFFEEICEALAAADRVIVADIFPARESDTLGMSGALLAAGVGCHAVYGGSLPAIARRLRSELSAGDLLVVMGAGDIHRVFGEFSRKDFTSEAK